MSTLSVATIISGAVKFAYPIEAVLASAAPIADEIVVNVDTSLPRLDGTEEVVFKALSLLLATKQAQGLPLQERLHWGRIIESPWNWDARDQGQELARQTNMAFDFCTKDWILYLQADEVIHEDDHEDIRWLLDLPEEFTAAQFMRLYFFGSPKTLRRDWTQPLVRMFRRGKARSVGDAMNCETDGLVWPHMDGTPRIFHYSRVADPGVIGRRIRNLDGLFHSEENLTPARPYDFRLRAFDTHATTENPVAVSPSVLERFDGTHPAPIGRWWNEGSRRRSAGADEAGRA